MSMYGSDASCLSCAMQCERRVGGVGAPESVKENGVFFWLLARCIATSNKGITTSCK